MNYITEIYRRNKVFFIVYFSIFSIALILALIFGRAQTHLFINNYHSHFCDIFFKYLTYLGSGWAIVIVMSGAAIVRGRVAGALLLSGFASTFLVQLLKRLVAAYRPVRFFEVFMPDVKLYLVEGVKIHYLHSFPSGHAATAFAIFLFLAFLTQKNWLKLIYLFIAILVAFSRVYLSQHFLIDVLVGSLIGVISTVLGLLWYLSIEKISAET